MAIGQTNVTMSGVYYELFRTSAPSNLTLEYLVQNSRLAEKTAPYDLGDFRGYDGTPLVTMSVLSDNDDNTVYVSANFSKDFQTAFTCTVTYTINKNNGVTPTAQTIDLAPNMLAGVVDFTADRRTADYQVSITFNSCTNASYTTSTSYITVPAKVATVSTPTVNGQNDAYADNERFANGEEVVGARPAYWGYAYGTTAYNEYMTAYNNNRFVFGGM